MHHTFIARELLKITVMLGLTTWLFTGQSVRNQNGAGQLALLARVSKREPTRLRRITTVHTGLFTEDGPPTQPCRCSEHVQTICCGREGQPRISFTEEDADVNTFTPFALVNG